MRASIYCKKPKPLYSEIKSSERKCIWEYWAFGKKEIIKCNNNAVGRFFCKKHLALAAKVDSCSFDGFSLGSKTTGGYGIG